MHKRYLIAWLILALSLLAACRGNEPTPVPSEETGVGSFEGEPILASGEVVPGQWLELGFNTSGNIDTLLVKEGDLVNEGDELSKLDEAPYQLMLSQASAALQHARAELDELKAQPRPDILAAAEAALADAQANLDQLQRSRARELDLAAAQAQVDSAQTALDEINQGASQSQLNAATAQVQYAQLEVDQARRMLEQTVLMAPFNGTVIEIYLREGEVANPGTPLLLLADLGSLQVVTTDLSELDVTRIQVGNPVQVTIDALPGQVIEGRVVKIANRSTPGATATYPVIIELDEIPEGLRWGMSAFVTIGE